VNIARNPLLPSVDTLGELRIVNSSVFLSRNDAMTSIAGLSSLESASFLEIEDNLSLVNLDGLENLEVADSIDVLNNTALADIDGLAGLRTSFDITIRGNPALSSVAPLLGITGTNGGMSIIDNAMLAQCDVDALAMQLTDVLMWSVTSRDNLGTMPCN